MSLRVGLVFDPIALAIYYERSVYNFNNDEQMIAVAEMRKNLQYVYCIALVQLLPGRRGATSPLSILRSIITKGTTGVAKREGPGLGSCVSALAHHFRLALLAEFSQPGTHIFGGPCKTITV